MGDAVKTGGLKAKQLHADKEYVKDCIAADEQHERKMELEKEKLRLKNLEIKYVLDQQVRAKK
jgi:hypothetical protein